MPKEVLETMVIRIITPKTPCAGSIINIKREHKGWPA
jgi:hypothetical protein